MTRYEKQNKPLEIGDLVYIKPHQNDFHYGFSSLMLYLRNTKRIGRIKAINGNCIVVEWSLGTTYRFNFISKELWKFDAVQQTT